MKLDLGDEDDNWSVIIICAGPPTCLFEGDEAVANANDGCPRCRRILIAADGTEREYRLEPQ